MGYWEPWCFFTSGVCFYYSRATYTRSHFSSSYNWYNFLHIESKILFFLCCLIIAKFNTFCLFFFVLTLFLSSLRYHEISWRFSDTQNSINNSRPRICAEFIWMCIIEHYLMLLKDFHQFICFYFSFNIKQNTLYNMSPGGPNEPRLRLSRWSWQDDLPGSWLFLQRLFSFVCWKWQCFTKNGRTKTAHLIKSVILDQPFI